MNNDAINTDCHFFFQMILVALIFGLTQSANAQSIDKQPTVVLLSLSAQGSDVFWPEGEDRITDELRLSDMHVITSESGAFEDVPQSVVQEALKTAADNENASAAIVAYKTGSQNAHLFLYVRRTADNSDIYREYDIPLSDSQDETDIAAFKVAELVQAMVDDMSDDMSDGPQSDSALQNPPPESTESSSVPQPKTRKPLSKKAKRALVFAISGAATVGLGAVFHVNRNERRDEANSFSEDSSDDYIAGRYRDAEESGRDYESKKDTARALNVATVASYAIGGALLVAAFGTLLAPKEDKVTENASRAFHMRGTNIVWEF